MKGGGGVIGLDRALCNGTKDQPRCGVYSCFEAAKTEKVPKGNAIKSHRGFNFKKKGAITYAVRDRKRARIKGLALNAVLCVCVHAHDVDFFTLFPN